MLPAAAQPHTATVTRSIQKRTMPDPPQSKNPAPCAPGVTWTCSRCCSQLLLFFTREMAKTCSLVSQLLLLILLLGLLGGGRLRQLCERLRPQLSRGLALHSGLGLQLCEHRVDLWLLGLVELRQGEETDKGEEGDARGAKEAAEQREREQNGDGLEGRLVRVANRQREGKLRRRVDLRGDGAQVALHLLLRTPHLGRDGLWLRLNDICVREHRRAIVVHESEREVCRHEYADETEERPTHHTGHEEGEAAHAHCKRGNLWLLVLDEV